MCNLDKVAVASSSSIGNNGIFANRFWQKLRRRRLIRLSLSALIIISLLSIIIPIISPYNIDTVNLENKYGKPNRNHWLGTDRIGRDVFVRLFYAGRISLMIGILGTSMAVAIGVFLGAVSGYFGGRVDSLTLKISELFTVFPRLLIIIVIVSLIGPSIGNLIVSFGLFSWPGTYRITRGRFLSLKNQQFVEAAKMIGASSLAIIFKHILPNALGPILVNGTLIMAQLIIAEAGLSFLGLGVPPPLPAWGNMLASAQNLAVLRDMPWMWLPPGLMISFTVLSINFLGDCLRDALDPYQNIE